MPATPSSQGRQALLWGLVVGGATLVAVHLLLYNTYWDYSEGVYALSAHLMLHGGDLYTQIVGAQPPGVFLAGVALLALHDGVEWLRLGVGCLQLGGGLIAGQIVLRLTGSRLGAVLTPVAILLTPWAVHEHGALTPELVAVPVLLGAGLLSVDQRRALPAGVLCGMLPLIKLPLVIPAVAIVLLSARPRRTLAWAGGTLAVGLALTTLLAGSDFWREVFLAQTQTGRRTLGSITGYWAQSGWNVLGLLVCGAALWRFRAAARDRPLLRAMVGLAAANLITFLTNLKQGTGLNITVPVEAALVPLAMAGAIFALRSLRSSSPVHRAGLIALACGAGIAFTLGQSVSLMASPHNPIPFLRAESAPAWEILMTQPQLRAAVASARACPRGEPYGGPPLIAFMAGRSVPAGQPDQFITTRAKTLSSVRARIAAVKRVCGQVTLRPAR
jgi:hypothetical protein